LIAQQFRLVDDRASLVNRMGKTGAELFAAYEAEFAEKA
jgi:hypothetical protein